MMLYPCVIICFRNYLQDENNQSTYVNQRREKEKTGLIRKDFTNEEWSVTIILKVEEDLKS